MSEEDEKLTVFIALSDTGEIVIASDDRSLVEDMARVRNKSCEENRYAVVSTSVPKDEAITLVKLLLEEERGG